MFFTPCSNTKRILKTMVMMTRASYAVWLTRFVHKLHILKYFLLGIGGIESRLQKTALTTSDPSPYYLTSLQARGGTCHCEVDDRPLWLHDIRSLSTISLHLISFLCLLVPCCLHTILTESFPSLFKIHPNHRILIALIIFHIAHHCQYLCMSFVCVVGFDRYRYWNTRTSQETFTWNRTTSFGRVG